MPAPAVAAAAPKPATAPAPAPAPMPNYNDILNSLIGDIGQTPNIGNMTQAAGFGPKSAVGMFSSMMDESNQANAARGKDILSLLQGQGKAQMAQNTINEQAQEGQINNDLTSRGLFNTTVAPNLIQGAQNNLARNNEQVSENAALNAANMANSFTQQGPSMGMLAQLLAGGGGSRVGVAGVNTGGMPGFQQPGSMLDTASGGGGALNVNNQAQSGYNAAMSPSQSAANAAWGFNGQTAWSSDPFMNIAMQTPAAQQSPSGPGSLAINGQSVYSGGPTSMAPDMSVSGDPLFGS